MESDRKMSEYIWSAKNNAFIPACDVSDYTSAGWDLSDAKEAGSELYSEFNCTHPSGKFRGVGVDGMPCWIDCAPPSQEELAAQAEAVKSTLQREAEDAIKPLERAKSLGIATPQELALLTEWEKYSVYLMRVDTSNPEQIVWPTKPQ
ncbi:MAG: tail fiber assembly protein [Plesiomonas shigelloides]